MLYGPKYVDNTFYVYSWSGSGFPGLGLLVPMMGNPKQLHKEMVKSLTALHRAPDLNPIHHVSGELEHRLWARPDQQVQHLLERLKPEGGWRVWQTRIYIPPSAVCCTQSLWISCHFGFGHNECGNIQSRPGGLSESDAFSVSSSEEYITDPVYEDPLFLSS